MWELLQVNGFYPTPFSLTSAHKRKGIHNAPSEIKTGNKSVLKKFSQLNKTPSKASY
jgi:hypothetical protein